MSEFRVNWEHYAKVMAAKQRRIKACLTIAEAEMTNNIPENLNVVVGKRPTTEDIINYKKARKRYLARLDSDGNLILDPKVIPLRAVAG